MAPAIVLQLRQKVIVIMRQFLPAVWQLLLHVRVHIVVRLQWDLSNMDTLLGTIV